MIPPYVFEADHEVVRDFAEYSGLPLGDVAAAMNDFRRLNREEWEALPEPSWEARAERFYGVSSNYVFDLLRGNPSRAFVLANLERFEPRILAALRAHPGRRFLEFGGGTGVFCQIMAEMGKDVTYVDLPGPVAEFAAWRFRRLGIRVKRLLVEPGRLVLPNDYDLIYSDAVFEHLVDPEGTARILAARLAPGGFFGLLVDLEGENPEMPMHRNVDIRAVHDALESSGLRPEFGRNLFASGWTRP